MADYTVVTEQAASRYGVEVGGQVELELDPGEELAVIAAGWLEPATKEANK